MEQTSLPAAGTLPFWSPDRRKRLSVSRRVLLIPAIGHMKKGEAMQTRFIAAILLGVLVSTAGAEEFYLKHDRTGKVYGPYQSDSGAKVKIGATTFTVVKKSTSTSAVEKKLEGVKIPQVELRQAALQDAVQFLQSQTRMLDPKKTGVNFVIAKSESAKKQSSDPFGAFGGGSDMGPMVTLSMKDVSALQVLKALMVQTGYSYKTEGNTVTIIPKKQ